MVQNVLYVEKRITGGKSVVHQRLTKRGGRISMVVKSFLSLQKGNLVERKIFIALRLVIKVKTALKHQFQVSYTSIL